MATYEAIKVKIVAISGQTISDLYCLEVFDDARTLTCKGIFRNDRSNMPRLDRDARAFFYKEHMLYWGRRPVVIVALDEENPETIGLERKIP